MVTAMLFAHDEEKNDLQENVKKRKQT